LDAALSKEAEDALFVDFTPAFGTVAVVRKTEPRPFQIDATNKLLSLQYCALVAPPGSGKTKIMIDVIQSLYQAGKIKKISIVCPCSVIDNWKEELVKHWNGEPPWDSIWITGIESYSSGGLYSKMLGVVDKSTVKVVDESSRIKNSKAKRTERLTALGEKASYRYTMTGTPLLNGEVDLFSQYRFLHPDIIGISTEIGFKNRYCIKGGFKGKQIIGYRKQEELLGNLRPYSFIITKEEAMPQMPLQTFVTRKAVPSPEQKRLINKIKNELLMETEQGDVNIQNVLTKMLRIRQISGGFSDGSPVAGANPKIEILKEIIEESPEEQFVIFASFIPEIKELLNILPNSGGIYGEIKNRQEVINKFQNKELKYLVCQYQSGSTGLNMHSACMCVHYSFDPSLEFWLQSIGRIARDGQERPMIYTSIIMSGSVDAYIHKLLMNKETMEKGIRESLATGNIAQDLF